MSDRASVMTTAIVGFLISACIIALMVVLFLNADHQRELMKNCLATERNAQDCHNAVYGPR